MKIKYLNCTPGDLARSRKPLMIFDFDGTLCDSLAISIEVFNGLAPRFRLPTISRDDLRNHRLRDTLARFGVRWYTLLRLVRAMKRSMRLHLPAMAPFPDTHAMLTHLHESGYTLGILTSNSLEITEAFLKLHKLPGFAFISSGASLFGKGPLLSKLLAKHALRNDQVVYIGDETRDVEAMALVGVPMIAVSWGWNSRALLEATEPNYLVDSHPELLGVLTSLGLEGV